MTEAAIHGKEAPHGRRDRCTCMSLAPFVHADTTADLQAMHDLLAAAGLSFWLVRHTWGVAIAVRGVRPLALPQQTPRCAGWPRCAATV